MSYLKLYLTKFMAVLIMLSVALAGVVYVPVNASADEAADAALTDDDFDDEDDEEDDDEDYEDDDFEMETVMNFCATSISKTSVKLKWDKAEDVDGYEVSYKSASSKKWITKELSASKTKLTVSKLKVDTKYNFRIRAFISYLDDDEDDEDDEDETEITDEEFDDEDDEDEDDEDFDDIEYGGYSKMNLRTLKKDGSGDKQAVSNTYEKAAPKHVKVPKIKKINANAGKASLTWKKSAKASGYEVYMSKKAKTHYKRIGTIKKVKVTKYTSKKLKKGTTYYFKLRAYVKQGSKKAYTSYSKVKSIKIK